MFAYLIRRFIHATITFLGITFVVFVLIHAVPGDPVRFFVAESAAKNVPPEVIAAMRHEYGLDRPLLLQYLTWLRDVTLLDFGESFIDRQPVIRRIAMKLPATIEINLVAFLIAIAIGVPLGVASGSRPGGRVDRASGAAASLLYSTPNFWAALLLLELFAVKLQILPFYGMASDGAAAMPAGARFLDHLWHLVLPATTLAAAQIAIFTRFTRGAIADVIGKEYIVAARARGVSEFRIVWRDGLRNASIQLVTLVGLILPFLLSGSVIIERIFQWDGVGLLYFDSILARDYPVIMGLTVVTALATLLASVATDVGYAIVDPRVRLGEDSA